MCDANGTRKSRRKQYTPARRSSIGTAAIVRSSDDACFDAQTVDSNGTLKRDSKSFYENVSDASLLDCRQYRQQVSEPMQRLSPSTASSTPPSSASTVDSISLSSDICPKEIPAAHPYISQLHALYLPVAFHNNTLNSVQVLGYPQVIIPVAINRHAQDIIKPTVYVDEFMARNITVPKQTYFGETQCNLEIASSSAVQLPKASYNVYSNPSTSFGSVLNPNTKKRKGMISNDIGRRQTSSSSDLKPLDLTVRIKRARQSDTTGNSNSSNCDSAEEDASTRLQDKLLVPCESDKKYRCDCGVSFNSELTLKGHKKYYCNNNSIQSAPIRKPQKKIPYHCQQCNYLPASAGQLAQHVRVNHATVQAYVCQICGYKGYSQRGIRSHLRTHTEYADEKTEDLMNSYVQFITAETKTLQCSNCLRDK